MNLIFYFDQPILPRAGGTERAAYLLAQALSRHGHRISFLSLQQADVPPGGLPYFTLPRQDTLFCRENREYVENLCSAQKTDGIINCAAFTNVDGCETARDAAFKVNAIGPRNLALACEKVNARLIHISTDYVFPGTANGGVALDECAVPAPISANGQTKLLGEQYVERFCRRHFIVRTAWLYSSYGKNFVKTMIRLGRTHDKITVVNDQLGNPTTAVALAYHILKLAVSHDYGIYHCTGNGICSWYDFASAIMKEAGLPCKVSPCTSAEYAAANPASASRPAWSALENRMLRCTVGDEMRDWQDALHDFFANWNGEL